MKFYIAGKWEDRDRVKVLMNKLVSMGHEITKNWTVDEEDTPGFPVINVVEDIRGVHQADVYVGVFLNQAAYKGALIEMGAALGLRKLVVIVGRGIDSCIFVKHPLVRQFDTIEDFIGSLL